MTEEQIKRKAKTYSTNYWYNTNNSVNVESIEKLLIDFATEATKELQEENIQLLKEWRTMDKAKQKVELKVAELMGDKSTLEQDCKRFQEQIEELKDHLSEEVELHSHAEDYIKSLEAQIEELKCNRQAVENARNVLDVEQRKYTKELEAQIEKMKCCGNCKHQYEGQYHDGFRCKDHYKEDVCESYEWELAE